MGRRRGHQRDPALGVRLLEGAKALAAESLEPVDRLGVVLGLELRRGPQLGPSIGGVAVGRVDAVAPEKGEHPLPHPVGLELVGEHRGHRHRQPLGDFEDRQVGAGEGVEQPLLAERVGPEPLDVGHVAVEDDRQVARELPR